MGLKKKVGIGLAVIFVCVLIYVALTSPKAVMTASSNKVGKRETVFFSGKDSTDPFGQIVSYEWDFGDGGKSKGINVEHSYTAGGTYTVKLIVTDDFSLTDSTEMEIEVVELLPQPEILAEMTEVRVGETVVFDASNSIDPDGEILSYEWDFGDGTTGQGIVVEHAYGEESNYDVSLKVVDDGGLANSTEVTIRVKSREFILAQAIEEEIVRAEITGLGAYNLLKLNVESLVPFKFDIAIPKGTLFLVQGNYPNMVYSRLLGIYKGYDLATHSVKYDPTCQITLENNETQTYVILVYSLNFNKPLPYSSSLYSVGGLADLNVLKILETATELPKNITSYEAMQASIWVATEDVTRHQMTESFQIEEEDIENARVILEAAFGDISIYTLAPPLNLVDVVDRGLIEVEFRGKGACAGDAIRLKITPKIEVSIDVEIEPGLILVNSGAGQNMIIAEENTLTVKVEIELELDIEAYCLDSHKDNPSNDETLTMQTDPGTYGDVVTEFMQSLGDTPSERRSVDAVQIALWVITDDISREEIRIFFSEQDIQDAEWLLENAGIDTSGKRLFQQM